LGIPFKWIVVRKAAEIGLRYYKDLSSRDSDIFKKEYSCYKSCWFIGMGSPEDKEIASLLFAFEAIHSCVPRRIGQLREIITELCLCRQSWTRVKCIWFPHA
jgi:hypothetical protein